MQHVATRTRSFRLAEETLERLEERASETSETTSALAARYLEEGLRTDEHPSVSFVNRAGGRRAMLAGTRLNIADVIAVAKAAGSAEAAAESLDLPLWKVRAAVAYYADFRDEIDAEIERDHLLAKREETRWRAEQSALV
jgi:uncharacterized protein (DUF433 family)